MLALPSAAAAVDTYVDATRPDNADPTCSAPATACKTLGGVDGAIAKAGTNDTISIVDPAVPTTYAESVFLDNGKSLDSLSSNPGEVIIDNGAGGGTTPAVFVPPPGTGGTSTISGLTIRSEYQALLAQRTAVIENNVFDGGGPLTNTQKAHVQVSGPGTVVDGNDFSDVTPTPGENQTGLNVSVAGPSEITDNGFLDLVQGMFVGGDDSSAPAISGNRFIGTRLGLNAGVGISVRAGDATITDNTLRQPFFAAPSDFIFGISLEPFPDAELGATLARNVILDHRFGVHVEDTTQPVTLESDLIADSVSNALRALDTGADEAGIGDVTATNVTLVDTEDPARHGRGRGAGLRYRRDARLRDHRRQGCHRQRQWHL